MQDSELKLAVEDAPPDIKRCAALIVQQREQRELQGRIERALRVALAQPKPTARPLQWRGREPLFGTQPAMITRRATSRSYVPSRGGAIHNGGVHPRATLSERRACGCWLCVK